MAGIPLGRHGRIYFQYMGKTALRVTGPRSGRRYRFERTGAIVAVDHRDRQALRAVSQLRQVAMPY